MVWVISFALVILVFAASVFAKRKGWLRTSKVLEAVAWFWPF